MAGAPSLRRSVPGFGRVVGRFWPHLRAYRGLIAGSSVALLAEIGLRLLEPWPLKFVFDRVLAAPAAGGAPAASGLLLLAAGAVLAISGLRALASYLGTVGFAFVGNRVVTAVRADVFHHLHALSLSFHTRARAGDLLAHLVGDVGMLRDATVSAVLPLLVNALTLAGMAALMLWIEWRLAVVGLAVLPLFWLVAARTTRQIHAAARMQRQQEGAMAATAAESIGAMKTVQALSLGDAFARAFGRENARSLGEGVRTSRLSARLERGVDVLIAVATALVLWYGARLVLRQALTPGDLLVFLSYLKSAFKPVKDFAKYTARLARATAAGERIANLLDQRSDVRDLPGAVAAPALRGAVRLDGVALAYEPGHPVLEGVDLEVKPGEHVALVGPSGSGKSSLVSLLLRLYDPTAGRVLVDGRDVREFTIASFRAQVSVVLQDTILFAATVRENIAAGAPDATPEAVEAAARLANALPFITRLPRGFDTVLGERGVTLSNGQRQRISIARAAVRRSPILILDEPTTGLDEGNERAVNEALARLAEGRTTFLVTHDLRRAAQADVIVFVEHGRLVERGTHAELMRAGGRYAALYRLQDAARGRGRRPRDAHAVGS